MATGVRAKNISPLRKTGNRRQSGGRHGDGRTGEKYFAPAENRKPPPIRRAPWRRAYGRKIFRPCGKPETAADPAGPWRRAHGRKIFRPCGTTETAADAGGRHGDGRTGEKYFAPTEQRKPPPIPAGPWRRAYGRKIFRPCGTTETAADSGGPWRRAHGRKIFRPYGKPETAADPAGAMATGVRAKNISPLRKTGNRRQSGGRHGDGRTGEKYFAPTENRKPPPIPAGPWRRAHGRKIFRPYGKPETAADSGGRHGDGRTGEKYFAPAEQRKPPPMPAGPWRRAYGRKIFRPCGKPETAANPAGAMATGVRAKNISPLRKTGNRRRFRRGHGDGRTGEKYFAPAENRKPPPMPAGARAKNISPLRNNGNRRRFRRGHGDGRTGEKYFAPAEQRKPPPMPAGPWRRAYG